MKELKMSIPQYNALMRNDITIKEIKDINEVDGIAKKILTDERLTKMTAFLIAGINIATKVSADPLDKVNEAGRMFLTIIQGIGYWLCLIFCMIEILKSLMNGSSKDFGKILIKYLMIFSSIYLMPWAFDLIKQIFA